MRDFTIIPVLDLKQGHVVRARAGDRAKYRPIVSPLAEGSAPSDLLRGLLRLAPFRAVYVADLDAIAGEGDHRTGIASLAETAPGLCILVDGGFAAASEAQKAARPGVVPVLGSETLASEAELERASAALGSGGFVLSLDYRSGRFLGPLAVERRVELWPDRVILMTLDRVGMDEGPDLAALAALIGRAGGRAVYAAGGVRHEADLHALVRAGVAGVLVASALHDGRLSAAALAAFTRRSSPHRR
jgi:phosphoribosylformimino-5-aminoimidazole carboxamide ribotide isomerase